MAAPLKAPVLYLRSFGSETLAWSDLKAAFTDPIPGTDIFWKNCGEEVASRLSGIGPVKALERPTSGFQIKTWAASRPETVRVPDHAWQQYVIGELRQAALVVVQLDVSTGLMWELRQFVDHVSPVRILLVLPPLQPLYAEMRAATDGVFPHPLPAQLPKSRLMTFRPDWQPLPLAVPSGSLNIFWRMLAPVLEQNGIPAARR